MLKRIFGEMKIPVGTANAVVSITVPPGFLDVNLEPSKLSVFIEGQERLFEEIQDKTRSHFGLDADENAPPKSNSPLVPEDRPEPRPASFENVQESSIVTEKQVPVAPINKTPISPQDKADADSSALHDKSLSMSSSGDASFVEVLWAGQQESTRANALSSVKQLSIDSWATGRAILSERTGVPVVPVAMVVGKETPKRSHVTSGEWNSKGQVSSVRSRDPRPSSASKRSKISELDETDSRLEDFLLKMEKKKENVRKEFANTTLKANPETRAEHSHHSGNRHLSGQRRAKISRRVRTVKLNVQAILHPNKDSLGSGRLSPSPEVESKVIGRLKKSPHWICQHGSDIYALNHHRFEETAIFDRLKGSRSLNTLELQDPIMLDDHKGWNGALNDTMLNMPRDGAGLVTDERIRHNGFVVKIRKDGLGGILLGVPRDVNFMGPADLSVSMSF